MHRGREPEIGRFPIPGLVRRARRVAGLSQRDIAEVAGLSRATVQRAETGDLTPSLDVLQRIMAAADLYLAVIDTEGRIILPMEDWQDGVRDGAGRRYPAHLDVILDPKHGEWWADRYGFNRPPETFRADPPDVRDYKRRYSAWRLRASRYPGPPPRPPGWWTAAKAAQRMADHRAKTGPPPYPNPDDYDVDEWDPADLPAEHATGQGYPSTEHLP